MIYVDVDSTSWAFIVLIVAHRHNDILPRETNHRSQEAVQDRVKTIIWSILPVPVHCHAQRLVIFRGDVAHILRVGLLELLPPRKAEDVLTLDSVEYVTHQLRTKYDEST